MYAHTVQLISDIAVIDPSHSASKPSINTSDIFNEWFGILFTDVNHVTHVREPTTIEVLQMYHIPNLHILCRFTIPKTTFCLALLHVPPLGTIRYLTGSLINDLISVLCFINPSIVAIYNCIISRPMFADANWTLVYSEDEVTVNTLSIIRTKAPLDQQFLK